MSSYAASCYTCFPKASCASGTSASWPIGDAPRSCHFASSYSARHRQPSTRPHPPMTQILFGSAPTVATRWWSSKDLRLPKSNFVLHQFWSRLPHETTLSSAKSLRASTRSRLLRLAAQNISSSRSSNRSCIYEPPFSPTIPCFKPSIALCRTLSTQQHTGLFPHAIPIGVRVRRNRGRSRSNGFIERAPEHRAPAHFFHESAPPIKR